MPRIDCLTGARFVAAAYVVLMHFAALGYLGTPDSSTYGYFLQIMINAGGAGVGFFFLLSGFVLTLNYGDHFLNGVHHPIIRSYLVARLARIYPLYLLALILAIAMAARLAMVGVPPWNDGTLSQYTLTTLLSLLAVQAWVPNLITQQLFNAPAWSVSTELFFYLLFPWIVGPLLRLARRAGALQVGIWIYGLQLLGYLAVAYLIYSHGRMDNNWLLLLDRLPLLRLAEFATGILVCYRLQQGMPPTNKAPYLQKSVTLGVVLLAAHLIWFIPTDGNGLSFWRWAFDHGRAYLLGIPIFAAIILLLSNTRQPITRLLTTTPVVLLGEASYALYLLHWPAIMLLFGFSSHGTTITPIIGWMVIGVTLIVALLAFRWLEQPARRAIRARFADTGVRRLVRNSSSEPGRVF